ncbi:MAG TPA: hypothetical protein VGJ18_19475 [Gemmatimonadaceae bacterium]
MPTGILSVTYELAIPNLVVVDRGPFTEEVAGPPRWTATLRPCDAGLELVIEIATDDPSNAAVAADNAARNVAEHISLWLCDRDIIQMVKPRRLGSPSFQSADTNTLHAFLGELALVGEAVTVRVTHRVRGESIAQLLAEFALREAAPTPATANDLVVARQMYIAGLSVENQVASFLITYAAAAVFATFKASTGALQSRIDAVLTAEDPTILTLDRRTASGKTVSETEFTAARNVFIHAEDRGRDPAAAMAKIESLRPRFQALVGRILRKG